MVYEFALETIQGQWKSLETYRGQVLLVVNTATDCDLTPQYDGLQQLYEKFHDQGFELLDVPCNQFFEQAPLPGYKIAKYCEDTYGATFETFEKVDVNGAHASELFVYLRKQAPTPQPDALLDEFLARLASLGHVVQGDEIQWNFTKFLISRSGEVIARFAPTTSPQTIAEAIQNIL
ncbi:MAG: glutathione peroxidase [Erysipelotrichaceae bacterium]